MSEKKITLKEARNQGKLEEFIKEHEKDASGDADALEKILRKVADKPKSERKKSK